MYSEGFVIYRDVTGDIQRMGCTFQPICNIVFMEYQQDWDGDFGAEDADDSNIGNLENGTAFSHTFIVDNIEIVDNDRFTWLASPVRKIVSQVRKIIVDAYLLHLRLQILPIAALPFVIDFFV